MHASSLAKPGITKIRQLWLQKSLPAHVSSVHSKAYAVKSSETVYL